MGININKNTKTTIIIPSLDDKNDAPKDNNAMDKLNKLGFILNRNVKKTKHKIEINEAVSKLEVRPIFLKLYCSKKNSGFITPKTEANGMDIDGKIN